MKLFATDLDGTLLDCDDGIHPRDLEAIRAARDAGVVFTIATGRLTSRTHPIARVLGLDAPLVCADGGVLVCSLTERLLRRRALTPTLLDTTLSLLDAHGLSRFVFTHDAIHSCERGVSHHAYVRGWAHVITAHADVRRAPAFCEDEEAALMVVGIGAREPIEQVAAQLEPYAARLDIAMFDIADARVLRLSPAGVSKGSALRELAAELGIPMAQVGVIGDWYNDLSMFSVAGHSYAMPHAPSEVKRAAHHVLEPSAMERGAIADALTHWLAELSGQVLPNP